ncbi:MAG: hypothetical protein ACXV5U_00595, partial [Ilumatobacteraceae bacterium]
MAELQALGGRRVGALAVGDQHALMGDVGADELEQLLAALARVDLVEPDPTEPVRGTRSSPRVSRSSASRSETWSMASRPPIPATVSAMTR